MEQFSGYSMDIVSENVKRIKAIFPDVVVENKIDIDKLLNILGEDMNDDFEKYEFKWKGKIESLQLAGRRSAGTLRPCIEESKNWDDTENLYIEGDNLEVLKLLQQGYHNKIKVLLLDPPYNTGQDFIYKDTFGDSLANYKEITEQGGRSNPETAGRYHTNWLNMIYPRLRLAKTLLTDDGVMFINIDDNEVHNLRKACDEAFGEDNFVAQFPWRKRTAKSDVPFGVSQDYEWILCYAKSSEFVACLEGGTRKYFDTPDLPGRAWRVHDLTKQTSAAERPNSFFTMKNPKTSEEYPANPNRTWAITEETFEKYYAENKIVFPGDYDFLNISKPAFRYFKDDDMSKAGDMFGFIPMSTNLPQEVGMSQDGTKDLATLFDSKVFGFPKPVALIKHLIKAVTNMDTEAIILDFFSGSATTAHAVMQLNVEDGGNRRFIMVQLPEKTDENSEAYKAGYENICEISKERIRRAGEKILVEKAEKEKQIAIGENKDSKALDIGFKVFKLDTSSIKKWDGTPVEDTSIEHLWERLNDMTDTIKHDRNDMDVVYEVLLKFGIDLNTKIIPLEFEDGGKIKKAYSVREDCLMLICLAEDVSVEMVEQMAELAPGNVVFAEDCFKTDTDITNAELVLKDRSISIRVI